MWDSKFLRSSTILRRIMLGLAAVLGLFALVVSLQSPEFRIERSITIQASPSAVFEQVNDLHLFQNWSPWAKLDPTMKTVFAGPEKGEGATYGWVGNDDVGEGKMTIVKSLPPSMVTIKLEFLKPMAATNETIFSIEPSALGTRVNWLMTGSNGFVSKAFALVVDIDRMVGKDFEKGLAQLKSVLETPKS